MKDWKIYLFLVITSFLIFSNGLKGIFIGEDDKLLLENSTIGKILGTNDKDRASPIKIIRAGLQHFGLIDKPIAHKIIAISIHALNACLVFLFLRLFFLKIPSLMGALLFAVHPIHTEAVLWVSANPFLTTATFVLLPYLLYEYATRQGINLKYYLLALGLFAYYSIGSVGFYSFFPLLLIASDLYFDKVRKNFKLWFLFIAIIVLQFFIAQANIQERVTTAALKFTDPDLFKPMMFVYSICENLKLMIWPLNLSIYHEPFNIYMDVIYQWWYLILFFPVFMVIFFKGHNVIKRVFFASAFFLIFLIPTFTSINLSMVISERYLYVPSIALCMVFALIYEKLGNRRIILPVILAILLALGIRTFIRNKDYADRFTFWQVATRVAPGNSRVFNNLGAEYYNRQDYTNAVTNFTKSLELNPKYQYAFNNLKATFEQQGRPPSHIMYVKKQIRKLVKQEDSLIKRIQ